MNITKNKLETFIKELPDTVDIEEVMYRPLSFSEDRGRRDRDSGGQDLYARWRHGKVVEEMVGLIWGEVAVTDWEGVYDYIARDSHQYAKHSVERIYQSVERLQQYQDQILNISYIDIRYPVHCPPITQKISVA